MRVARRGKYGVCVEATRPHGEGVRQCDGIFTAVDPPVRVTVYQWSREVYEHVFAENGLEIEWVAPTVSDNLVAEHEAGFWDAYLEGNMGVGIIARPRENHNE